MTMASTKLGLFNISLKRKKITLAITLIVLAGIVGYHASTASSFIQDYIQKDTIVYDSKKQRNVLINLTNFYYLHNPKTICSQQFKNQRTNNIIGVVHSSRENFISREIIRRTHGSVTAYRGWHIQVVFTLGTSPPTEEKMIEGLIQREAEKYGDLIIGNFEDTYKNLSYKHVLGYQWSIDFCEGANYYLKSDDDVVLNLFFVINFLESVNKTDKYDKDKDYYCYIYGGTKPERGNTKWNVPIDEYPKQFYPDYCGYGSYFVSIGTIRKIAAVSSDAGFLWVDDAFVSGVLRVRANEKETIPNNSIKLRHGGSHYQGFDKNLTNALELKNMLGIIEEERSPSISCGIWNSIVEVYDVSNIYVTKCHELL